MYTQVNRWRHTVLFVLIASLFFGGLSWQMGVANLLQT